MQSVALIDYGSGNLRSAEKALVKAAERVSGGARIVVTHDPETVAAADRVMLPGVGAFAACKAALDARPGLIEAMAEVVHTRGVPFLGVCVGMQLLATRGLEFGETAGLDWIPGEVKKLATGDHRLKVPHMGWNSLEAVRPEGVLAGTPEGEPMYFTHSFAFHPADENHVAAWAMHGERFPAAVVRGNVAGVQFHPEKSQGSGISLLARFLEWRP